MNFYFCEYRRDYYLSLSGEEIDELSRDTLLRWAKKYPPKHGERRYFSTDEDRLVMAKGNTAREELAMRARMRRNAFCHCGWSC